jgi:hypothetical protein
LLVAVAAVGFVAGWFDDKPTSVVFSGPDQSATSEPPDPPAEGTELQTSPLPEPPDLLDETKTLVWQRLDPGLEGKIFSVVAWDGGFVAVGVKGSGARAVVWFSENGTAWQQVEDPSFDDAWMESVAAAGPGLVAVGGESDADGNRAAVWVSEDGLNWEQVSDASFGGPNQPWRGMQGVAAGGPGLVAIGHINDGHIGGENLDAAVWVSEDGLAWDLIESDAFAGWGRWSDPFVPVGEPRIVAGGPGLVAIGDRPFTRSDGVGSTKGVIGVSEDGLVWELISDSDLTGPPDAWVDLRAITVGGPGLVAVGSYVPEPNQQEPDISAVWLSTNGRDWERVESPLGRPMSVMAYANVLVAVGDFEPGSADGEAATHGIWQSQDGLTWNRQAVPGGPGGGRVTTVAAGDPGLVAIGPKGEILLGTVEDVAP